MAPRLIAAEAPIDHYVQPVVPTELLHAARVSYLTHALLHLAVLVALAVVAPRFVRWLGHRIERPWLHRLVAVAVIMTVASLPDLALLPIVGGAIGALLCYALVRRFPRTWWRAAVAIVPIAVIMPIVDAEQATGTRLTERAPALADRIESLAARRGVSIDRDRMFIVASPLPDARTAGFGPWHTMLVNEGSLAELDDRELTFLVAHEVGHYYSPWLELLALLAMGVTGALLVVGLVALVRRCAPRTFDSPASLPIALLAIAVLGLIANPVRALVQRCIERTADRNALRLLVPLYPDARQMAAHSLQRMGEVFGAPADDSAVDVLRGADHPPIGERIAFVLSASVD